MSPHDPGLFSLINSFFEPNFLILVTYFYINLYLAFRVIRIATRKYRQLKVSPPESVELSVGADRIVMDAHAHLFRDQDEQIKSVAHTPFADAFIRLATWAFNDRAAHAKRIFMLFAILSLGSTWYYMIAFLRHSYISYLERCHLTSYPLPPSPPPFDLSRPDLLVPALHLRILRISQWLASLSLFKEAWMEVIKDSTSWWWSSEICIITVGAWDLFLRHEAERLRIPHVWTFMALGQLVAISFALNLFNLGVIYRLDARDLLTARADQILRANRHAIEPLEEHSKESSPPLWAESNWERPEETRPVRIALAPTQRSPYHAHPLGSPEASVLPTRRRSPDPNVRVFSTTVTVQRKPLPPRPTLMDKFARTMQRFIPEKVGLPLFVLAGLSSVLQHPNSFTKVMVMHLFPLLISLYPTYHQPAPKHARARPWNGESVEPEPPLFRRPTVEPTTKQVLRRMLARTNSRVPVWKDAKMYYLGLGTISILLRLWLTIICFIELHSNDTNLHQAWRTITVFFPTTFFRHPAQSSISSDHACVALSATMFVLIESGLWLWKAAISSPSARLRNNEEEELTDDEGERIRNIILPHAIRLDRADRKVIETQARFIAALLTVSPFLGGSATLSFYLAVRCTWVQQYGEFRKHEDDELLNPPSRTGSNMIEDTEELLLVENEVGEQYLEVRKTKISEMRPARGGNRTQGASPPRQPEAAEEEIWLPPNSTWSAEPGRAGSEQGTQWRTDRGGRRSRAGTTESEAEVTSPRRTTPIRHRQPPQRYREDT
ncbi:uncharacterized protein MEPE_06643 [Melanopsichium pennsylvanicum]|uniref:Uncharacterized protein n=2 Tax=Melanopsichium pennsylvanicum TaxID=63383 RepID=A0AAJ5C8E8_9BASI|nr:putative protein [Melanopsichium pennsylvanicum 4]SNX87932.1 uncharacterized protein MEPE_06643 [Melanopsichium pennsylvanicum]